MSSGNNVKRRIDDIGRIMIPISFRKKLDLHEGTSVDITITEDGGLLISKSVPSCAFCGAENDLVPVRSKHICKQCLRDAVLLGGS